MKTVLSILSFLFILNGTMFGQAQVDWKTQKNVAFAQTGISTEGSESSFSTQLFASKKQFIELKGGAGIFSPNANIAQTISSGLTFNRGFKNHYLSVGLQMTYASNDAIALESYLKQEAYLSKALIGYQYSTSTVDFKLHVQPLSGISQRISSLGSTASIRFRL